MAAAALAYKCMEVAYMRVVYCKSFVTKHDLQTSMQMVTQGMFICGILLFDFLFYLYSIKQCIPIKSYILCSFMENVENRATEYYRTFLSCVTHKKGQ